MQVTADQPKKVTDRRIIIDGDEWSLELVEFSTANSLAYGWRVFSDVFNGTTGTLFPGSCSIASDTLYDDNEEATSEGYRRFRQLPRS